MTKLLIIGAGGFGRELLGHLRALEQAGQPLGTLAGFLDANPRALDGFGTDLPIRGDPESWQPQPDEQFLCAIGQPATKLRLCAALAARGARFATLVHPAAQVGPHCTLGPGCILCPGAVLTSHVTLGAFVTLNLYATIGHDAVVGDGCTLSSHCDLTGGVRLGNGVFAGSHAAVLPGVIVGAGAVLGAGSVVLRDVPPATTVFGLPAQPV
ncbi:MAG: acetyltransferase [Lentisphaeria bacterium]|jgi:sugar O-acyltransferase (sialic acid O-acetyltransferase NeuD family)